MHQNFVAVFSRPDVAPTNINSLCKRMGWMTGRNGCFPKGQMPHNKGQKMAFNANSAATRFKTGIVPQNIKPLWSERIGKSGYIEMKVPEVNPYTGHSTRYRLKHIWLWEKANGPIPEGMALKSRDGDRTNAAPENWTAVPRAILPRLNGRRWSRGYDKAPAELKPAIMAVTKLEHAAREAMKAKEGTE
ncbi:HNH endonuclease signature motif containing protein [Pseudorhodobacter sp.]|uniref:HNH endonuclease signature motif containing protein n=1 Tax=Pseudorhodobacter sp. TaxID=1934400 RepID=UPI002648C5B4|nr:HNH endonuclease signature motif containing protein [Pseudorhodobacter sp.]